MCKLSTQLKFCTCDVVDVTTLDHYWVLHRFNPHKRYQIIGRVAQPATLDAHVEAHNRAVVLQRLHEPDAFDIDLQLQDGDRLQVSFLCTEPSAPSQLKRIIYGYTWAAGRWTEEPFDPLSWQWHHDRALAGDLTPPLESIV